MLQALGSLLAWPLLGLVWVYRFFVSPWLGNNCRYAPSCSKYALDALRLHGAFRGSWLAIKRIGRCHPWGGSGYDPVPEKQDDPVESELDIPMPANIDEETERDRHLLQRTTVLNHAYGIVSRGNRAQGLEHIYKVLADDPYDEAGWAWFLDNMLLWENPEAALAFAQQYVHELLSYGENVKAVKIMMRCQLVNPAFKPLFEDLELAAAAAEECHNDELASFLR